MGNDVAGGMIAARRIRAEWLAVLGIDETTAAKMSLVDVPVSVVEEEGFLRLARGMDQERFATVQHTLREKRMPREITTHAVSGADSMLRVLASDDRGSGNANHEYQIVDVSRENTAPDADRVLVSLDFQNGPIPEFGINGITNETLIAVLIDRLEGFQGGQYAHPYNADALTSLRSAMASLKQRTRDRLARGVEGTMQQ